MKRLPLSPNTCRDCSRPVRWHKDGKDPKGARCWDCAKARREAAKANVRAVG